MVEQNFQEGSEELFEFYNQIGQYVRKHPEFAEELKYRFEEDKNPKKKGLDYYVKHGFRNMKEDDVENVTEQIYETIFQVKEGKKSLIQRVSHDAFKKLISGFLSENYLE